jgi:hypothetical protein
MPSHDVSLRLICGLGCLSPLGANVQTVNIHDAKTHFSRLVDAAANGEEIVIAKAGKPAARHGSHAA